MPAKPVAPSQSGLFGASDPPEDQPAASRATPSSAANGRASVVSVSELTATARELLEKRFPLTWVRGEISNFMPARSGHWYFVLKDATSQVRAVMFRHRNQYLDWQPRDGLEVEARALVTLYEPRGDFQLNVETMRRAGAGALYEQFVALRDRLAREGLFDAAAKRALPAVPRRIGVISSPAAAALRDVLTTLARRDPSLDVIVYPSAVQGAGAARELVAAIERASRRNEVDVLILARGGGSIEDLWAFNDEALARAIRAAPMPVVAGIGHETDFTIADFAADVRAPTPTAAAEVASPSRDALLARTAELTDRLARRLRRDLEVRMQALDALQRRLVHPRERVRGQTEALAQLVRLLAQAMARGLDEERWRLGDLVTRVRASRPALETLALRGQSSEARLARALGAALERRRDRVDGLARTPAHLDPRAVLARGFAIVTTAGDAVVSSAAQLRAGDAIRVDLADGRIAARVTGGDAARDE